MNFSKTQQSPARKYTGLIVVALLHIGIVYALVNGLARKVVDIVQAPLETKIIEELKKLPPPPPPPPKDIPPPPKSSAPPPAYVPPVEVPVQAAPSNAPSITSSNTAPPPSAPAPVVEVHRDPVVVPPQVNASACRKPVYPAVSRREEEQGVVVLRFLVNAEGTVVQSEVKSSSGYARLDEAARQALSLCKFQPGTSDGKPVQGWAQLKYEWRLE
ncbi:MAG: energy transducer TonB [Limnobacter sp.]|uniref:energy transducer TonB n=1 Tax=Limnobacter sp. TaxID=2003368 RepID=UPI00391C8758